MGESLLNSLIGLGVGGVLAGLVLQWKRQDDQRYQEELRTLTERMLMALDANTKAMQGMTSAVEALCSLQKMEERLGALEKRLSKRTFSDSAAGHA